jgi:hypothetical protein
MASKVRSSKQLSVTFPPFPSPSQPDSRALGRTLQHMMNGGLGPNVSWPVRSPCDYRGASVRAVLAPRNERRPWMAIGNEVMSNVLALCCGA